MGPTTSGDWLVPASLVVSEPEGLVPVHGGLTDGQTLHPEVLSNANGGYGFLFLFLYSSNIVVIIVCFYQERRG